MFRAKGAECASGRRLLTAGCQEWTGDRADTTLKKVHGVGLPGGGLASVAEKFSFFL